MQSFSSYNWFTQQRKPQSSYYSAIQWATGLQLYYVIADQNVSEQLNAIVFKLQLIYSTLRTWK